MNLLEWIQDWYCKNCADEWADSYGIKIETLDNPGWLVKIDVRETPLENNSFDSLHIDGGDDDWIFCDVKDCVFQGAGDPTKLTRIFEVFRDWAERPE